MAASDMGDGAALLRARRETWEGCGVGTMCLERGGSCMGGCMWAAEKNGFGDGVFVQVQTQACQVLFLIYVSTFPLFFPFFIGIVS